jgi:predicted DNA-binding protein YlxM (UPF0122 family)
MRIQKLTALLAILVLLPAAAAMVEKGAKEEKKELSNTRTASCLVKVTCDPAILPLSFDTIEHLLRSSGVGGKAIREIFGIAALPGAESEGLVDFGIEPLSDEPSSDERKGRGRPYGVELDEEKVYVREMGAPRGMGPRPRKKHAMPMRGGFTYTSQRPLFFQLAVELEPDDVKPAAEEFMKALLDNLRKTLDAAFDDYRKKFNQQLDFAHRDVHNAEADLAGLQEKLRQILGTHNLERQAILDDISRSRKELQATEMKFETDEAFVKATSKRIVETEGKMRNKINTDPVLAELQKIIAMHEERLKKLMRKGTPEELSQARENLARARIELAQRREQVSQSAGAELINSLRNQISQFTIERAQAGKRMEHLSHQLEDAQVLLERADEYERFSLRLKIAKQTLEESLLLQSRMKRKSLLIQPSVVVFGAD